MLNALHWYVITTDGSEYNSLNHHTTGVWWVSPPINLIGVHGYPIYNVFCVPEQEYRVSYFLYNVHLYMHVLCLYSTATCPMICTKCTMGYSHTKPLLTCITKNDSVLITMTTWSGFMLSIQTACACGWLLTKLNIRWCLQIHS